MIVAVSGIRDLAPAFYVDVGTDRLHVSRPSRPAYGLAQSLFGRTRERVRRQRHLPDPYTSLLTCYEAITRLRTMISSH